MVVGAVDVQVRGGVAFVGVGAHVGAAEDAAVAVGADDEFAGGDGDGFAFREEVPAG